MKRRSERHVARGWRGELDAGGDRGVGGKGLGVAACGSGMLK